MARGGVLVWLFLTLISATVALARPGIVRTRDGQTYDGEVDDKDPDNIVVTVRGIQTSIPRVRIASIDYANNYQKEFADRLAKLGPADVSGRLALARDAFNQKQYGLARQAAESARMIDPNNADAVSMLETIQSQMRLEHAKTQATPEATRPQGMTGAGAATTEPTTQPNGQRVLKATDINAIRQAELRPEDSGVRVRFERDVKKRFISRQGIQQADFNSLTINQQADEIIRHGTPEMKRDVQILNDPPALFQYRRQIQPGVIANCTTSGCHGGGAGSAAKFDLVVPADSDAATYTNFYILQNYSKSLKSAASSGNVFGRGDLKMIDRQQPERSMLLQYALPGAIAEHDHPDVPNYRPALRGTNDPKYRQILDWIGKSLKPVDPEYGIDFPVPGSASTQPAGGTTAPVTPAVAPAAAASAPAQLPPDPFTPRGARPPTTRPMRPAPPVRVPPTAR